MSTVAVKQCDVCGKLIVNMDSSKGIHTEEMDFCESCKDSIRRDIKGDVKNLRAFHVLIDIVAAMLEEESKEEEDKKSGATGTTNTSGFAPSGAAH